MNTSGQYFELTLTGFDGGTDETDDRILWVAAPDQSALQEATQEVRHLITATDELPPSHMHPDCIDATLPGGEQALCALIKSRAQGE